MRWGILPLVLMLLAPPSAALPEYYAIVKSMSNCTQHPEKNGDLPFRHKMGTKDDQ